MSRRAKKDTPESQARRIKEGRGQGTGRSHRPWDETKDVPSKGRRHRVYSRKFHRVLHLMSDLELFCLYLAEWLADVLGCLECKALLPLSETQRIGENLGHKHPRPPGGRHDIIMTQDFMWIVRALRGIELQPISVKPKEQTTDPRVLEKHSIAAEYWRRRNTRPLKFFTGEDVSRVFVRNWDLIRGTLRPGFFACFPRGIVKQVDRCLRRKAANRRWTLGRLTDYAAQELGYHRRKVLPAIQFLVATKTWPVDLTARELVPSQPLGYSRILVALRGGAWWSEVWLGRRAI